MAHDIFISYSSKDKTVAHAVVSALENENIRCWYAPRDIQPGADWGESITEAIHDCKVFLLIFSKNSNQSKRVLDEVYFAISEEKTIVPFRIENLVPTGAMRLHLSSKHWLDAYDPSWSSHLNRLSTSLEMNLGREVTFADEMEESPQLPPAVEAAPKKKPPWLWISLAIVLTLILTTAGIIWATNRPKQVATTPTSLVSDIEPTEVVIVSNPTVTLIPDTPTTVPTEISPILFRDDFDNALAEGWNILREVPTHWSLTDNPGSWRVTLIPGTDDGFIPELPTNVLLRDAPNGDFEIATLVHFTPTSNYQFAGLFIYQDDQNIVQLGRSFCDRSDPCLGNGIYFDSISDVIENIAMMTTNPSTAYLRLRREGTTYTGYYSEDCESWTLIGQNSSNINPTQVGLMAGQALEVETTADFEYFTLETLPSASPGGGEWHTLNFNIPDEIHWRQSGENSYMIIANPSTDTIAWSDEIITSDFILTAEVTHTSPRGAAMFIVYGDGIGFSNGCLIVLYGSSVDGTGWAAFEAHSIYEESEILASNFGDFYFYEAARVITIEITGGKANLYVDGQKVVSTFLPSEINHSGRIGILQHWEQPVGATYSNIRIKNLNVDE